MENSFRRLILSSLTEVHVRLTFDTNPSLIVKLTMKAVPLSHQTYLNQDLVLTFAVDFLYMKLLNPVNMHDGSILARQPNRYHQKHA